METLDPEHYRVLVEHSPMMMWRAGLDSLYDYFNSTWLAFTGRTLEQEKGKGWVTGIHPDDVERSLGIYVDSFNSRVGFEMEYRLRRQDGVYRYIVDRGVPYVDDRGHFAGFIGACVDIDDRRQVDEAKQTFLTMIAHELRTPLMPLVAAPTLLRRRIEAGKELEPTLASIERQIERFAKLVASFSEISNVGTGIGMTVFRVPSEVGRLVQDVVETHDQALRVHARPLHRLVFVTPERPLWADVDGDRIRQVLLNLLDNAIKYSPDGGEVIVRCELSEGLVRIAVSDPGVGIPEADLESVTRRFFRASNADPKHFAGLGLGLAIAREIAEAHGGHLSIRSRVGEGTTVTLNLPEYTGVRT